MTTETVTERKLTNEQFIDALAVIFDEISPGISAEIDAALREAGYDPDELALRMQAAAERALRSSQHYPPELGHDSKMEACFD